MAMSARVALTCTLVLALAGGDARAEDPAKRRPVAVIELSDSPDGLALAKQLGQELNNDEALKPIDQLTLQPVLIEPTVEEDAAAIADARRYRQAAEDEISSYKFGDAARTAQAGLDRLASTTPTPAVTGPYAKLSFSLGAALLGERDAKQASLEFQLAHAIDPAFKPDAIRYLPEIVEAYESAIAAPRPSGKIDVTGTGRVYLDGRDTGADAPSTFDVPAGAHVVWLVGTDRASRSQRAVVEAGKSTNIAIPDVVLDQSRRVRRAKLALRSAPDPAARAAAMLELANLLQVRDAVLLTSVNGTIVVQTWRDRAPGFSALREYHPGKDTPAELLEPLLPPKKPVAPKVVVIPTLPHPIDTRAWYEKPRYQIAGGVTGAVLIGIAIYALSTWDRRVAWDGNPGFQTRPSP